MSKWQEYSDKFNNISSREQYLIILTGLVAVIFITFSLFIDKSLIETSELEEKTTRLMSENKTSRSSIAMFEDALQKDPNEALNKQVLAYENKLKAVDDKLLLLTSELINPIQMRFALLELLQVQKGVSLQSFQLLGAQALMENNDDVPTENKEQNENNAPSLNTNNKTDSASDVTLYQHGIRLTLTGKYFQLRDYLTQLEAMSWKFFWKDFTYTLKEYPLGELQIEMYSLSTNKEFIGV